MVTAASRFPGIATDDDIPLLRGPSGSIGVALAVLGEGPDARIRVGTLARLMRISRQTLWRQCTRKRLVDANGLVPVASVRALSDDYETRIMVLLEHARSLRDGAENTTAARLERIEKAIETLGALMGVHPWSASPISPPRT